MSDVIVITILAAACIGITYLALARGDRRTRP